MDYELLKKALSVRETVFDGCKEQPVDVDITLPDYCPDIQKILKCQIYPKILSRNVSGDRLDIEGTVLIQILYIDSVKKTIRTAEHTCPFSTFFNLKSTPQNVLVVTKTKPEYLNCRAISPRRLDIHGAFSICANVICKGEKTLVTAVDADDVEQKKQCYSISRLTGLGQQQFSFNEDIEIGSGKPPVECILKSQLKTVIKESKSVAGKVMVKGEITLRILYLSDLDSGNVEVMDYTAAFSQIVDAPGIEENHLCKTTADALSYDVKLRSDLSEDSSVITLDAKIIISVEGYCDEDVDVIADAFSKTYEIDMAFSSDTVNKMEKVVEDTLMAKDTLELNDESISKVIDIYCEQTQLNTEVEDGKTIIRGKIYVCILALDGAGCPIYKERTLQFDYPVNTDISPEKLLTNQWCKIASISYRLNGENHIDIRAEVKLCIELYQKINIKCISKISANEEKLRKKNDKVALTLYYAECGETVWDIARSYCTCPGAIKTENELSEDIVTQGRMLLIPNI